MDYVILLISILVFAQILIPLVQKRILWQKRLFLIRKLEQKRKSRVITLIHRQETLSLLGIPITRYIDIEDAEQVLNAIRAISPRMAIDLILHTPGGLVLAAEQIAFALKQHEGKVRVIIPHYAMSGGTMIALASDEIIMSRFACLGSLDPILGSSHMGYFPAASIISALRIPNRNREDTTLILGDIARKGLEQMYTSVFELLRKHFDEKKASSLAFNLTQGRWTHDYPLFFEQIKDLGLPVSDEVPHEVYELMKLYAQPVQIRQAVEFLPSPYVAPTTKPKERKK